MAGIIKRITTNFALAIPRFDMPGWGAAFERNMDIIDAILALSSDIGNIIGVWENNTVYAVDSRVVDDVDNTVWQCAVSHTSGTGTFAADRSANPTYWNAVSPGVVVREEFVTGTDYFVNDFVYDTAEHLGGIVIAPFTGGATLRTNIADLGIIFDLKADLADIPNIQTDITTLEGEVNDLQDGTHLNSLVSHTPPVDADTIGIWDSVASVLKKVTWSNIKATLFGSVVDLTGGQIKFPSTSIPSTDVNTLDDYQEGTFTPTLRVATSTAGIAYAANGQQARYVKVGSKVTVWVEIVLSSKGGGSGNLDISGLPFVSKSETGFFWANAVSYNNVGSRISALIPTNSSSIVLYNAVTILTAAEIANNSEFIFMIEYETAL